jgi:hypothetical protein
MVPWRWVYQDACWELDRQFAVPGMEEVLHRVAQALIRERSINTHRWAALMVEYSVLLDRPPSSKRPSVTTATQAAPPHRMPPQPSAVPSVRQGDWRSRSLNNRFPHWSVIG